MNLEKTRSSKRQHTLSEAGTTLVTAYDTNRLGSVRALTDSSSSVVQTYGTDAWGVPIAAQTQGTGSQSMQYTGEQVDSTGLVNLRARMYDPSVGRFLQRDAYAGVVQVPPSLHRFSYTGSNPTTYTDATVQCVWDLCIGEATAVYLGVGLGAAAFTGWWYLGGGHDQTVAAAQFLGAQVDALYQSHVKAPARAAPRTTISAPAITSQPCPGSGPRVGPGDSTENVNAEPGVGDPSEKSIVQRAPWWMNLVMSATALWTTLTGSPGDIADPGHWGEGPSPSSPTTVVHSGPRAEKPQALRCAG